MFCKFFPHLQFFVFLMNSTTSYFQKKNSPNELLYKTEAYTGPLPVGKSKLHPEYVFVKQVYNYVK